MFASVLPESVLPGSLAQCPDRSGQAPLPDDRDDPLSTARVRTTNLVLIVGISLGRNHTWLRHQRHVK